jgi:hypothetical protein
MYATYRCLAVVKWLSDLPVTDGLVAARPRMPPV